MFIRLPTPHLVVRPYVPSTDREIPLDVEQRSPVPQIPDQSDGNHHRGEVSAGRGSGDGKGSSKWAVRDNPRPERSRKTGEGPQ